MKSCIEASLDPINKMEYAMRGIGMIRSFVAPSYNTRVSAGPLIPVRPDIVHGFCKTIHTKPMMSPAYRFGTRFAAW